MTSLEQMADGTPTRLGSYRLVRPISTGGMARVFEARRESLAGVSPRVALKVILPDYASNEAFRQLFVNEARIGSLLRHQNIVQIQDFDAADGLYYLVMEYVDGITLRQAIRLCRQRGVMVPLAVIAEIGRQVCDGLHHAHAARDGGGRHLRLVHRDLKPSNLMINPQGVVKLLDFGISHARIAAERPGAVRGTWGYMAPEQAAGGDLGPPADLFGLAAVLYEMATLQPLFPEKDPETVRRLLAADEAARRASRLTAPYGPLVPLLVRSLQRDALARFPSAAALGRSLQELAPDPMLARDELVRFQHAVVAAGQSPAPAAERPRSSTGEVASSSSLGGLPIHVGDEHRVRRRADSSRRPPPGSSRAAQAQGSGLPALLTALFVGAAVGILGFTAWRLLEERASDPPAAPPAAPSAAATPSDHQAAEAALAAEPPPARAPEQASRPTAEPERSAILPPAAPPASSTPASSTTGPSPEETSPARIEPAAPPPPQTVVVPVPAPPAAQAAPEAAAGHLTIGARPRAQVLIDGRFVRDTPLFRHEVPAGTHTITLVSVTGERVSFTVGVLAGQEVRRMWSFDENRWVQE